MLTMDKERTAVAPTACPDCGEAAYIGMNEVECTNYQCRNFHEKTWERHVMALPDDGMPKDTEDDYYDILDEEETQPRGFAEWLPDTDTGILGGLMTKQQKKAMKIMDDAYDKKLNAIAKLVKQQMDAVEGAVDDTPVPFILTDDD